MSRPGAELLESLIAAELRGMPGPALEAALAAAASAQSGVARATHLLDAANAALMAGEPKRTQALLAQIDTGGDPVLERRKQVCRNWSVWLDRNWFPGDYCSSSTEGMSGHVESIEVTATDPETRSLEACFACGPVTLLSVRGLLDQFLANSKTAAGELLGSQLRNLESLDQATGGAHRIWAFCSFASLLRHAGNHDAAQMLLRQARELCRAAGDAIGQARTHLWECDWYLTPGAQPESLGLPYLGGPAEEAALERAEQELDNAAGLLGASESVRLRAAIALRRSVLASLRRQWDAQVQWLHEARAAFERAGESASVWLTCVHELIATVDRGDLAAILDVSGAGWILEPRGPVRGLMEWANAQGSASYCAGLGRILELSAERRRASDPARAQALFLMAYPLLRLIDPGAAIRGLANLAEIDHLRQQPLRAMIRWEQCYRLLPQLHPEAPDKQKWTEHLNAVVSIVAAQTSALSASYGNRELLAGLETSVTRLRALVAAVGASPAETPPPAHSSDREELERIAASGKDLPMSTYGAHSDDAVNRLFEVALRSARDSLGIYEPQAALHRARTAERLGLPAGELFARAIRSARGTFLEPLALTAAGRDAEARALMPELRRSGALSDANDASLSLRVRDFAHTRRIFQSALPEPPAPAWADLADRAEAALECGFPAEAMELARRDAVMSESRASTLMRDAERTAALDDVKSAALYLVAARAGDATGDREAAFAFTERARRLGPPPGTAPATAELLAWRQAGAEWSAAFDLVRKAVSAGREPAPLFEQLESCERRLVACEFVLERQRPAGTAQEPVSLAALRQALAARDAVVLEYLAVGKDLAGWCIGPGGERFHYQRLAANLEGSVRRFARACAAGAPSSQQQAALAVPLLAPFAAMLRPARRVIVVPFGPLFALPFHALELDGQPFGQGRAISVAPSASSLAGAAPDEPLAAGRWVAVGDPAFDAGAYPRLRRLPGADVEAGAVARLRPDALVLRGPGATEDAVRGALASPCAFVHLAAHGLLDESAPTTSSLVLAGAEQLTVADLAGLSLDVDLAILSACDTGRGAATMGGELIGLARALLTAGVRRCVVSLWPVDDVPACVLMHEFHTHLASGTEPPAHALAAAQQSVRAMSRDALFERYRALGGGTPPGAGSRSLRRGQIALDPEFEEHDDEGPALRPVRLDGALPRVWAPFLLFGC